MVFLGSEIEQMLWCWSEVSILSKAQSLLNQHLNLRDSRTSSSYSFVQDVPLIATVIARAPLYCMLSIFANFYIIDSLIINYVSIIQIYRCANESVELIYKLCLFIRLCLRGTLLSFLIILTLSWLGPIFLLYAD